MSNFKITTKKTPVTTPNRRYDFNTEVTVSDGQRTALFVAHGENALDKYTFNSGTTSNGIRLWTANTIDLKSDMHFRKTPNYWGKRQDKATEFADMLDMINICDGLPILYADKFGTVTYEVNNGKIENVVSDTEKDLFDFAYEAMANHDHAKSSGFPSFYISKLENEAARYYASIQAKKLEKPFNDYVRALHKNTRK